MLVFFACLNFIEFLVYVLIIKTIAYSVNKSATAYEILGFAFQPDTMVGVADVLK